MMKRLIPALIALVAILFIVAPVLVALAPYESTMGLVQKIFYFHVPSWIAMYSAIYVNGAASAVYLFRSRPGADRLAAAGAELAVLFGMMGLVTGPLWGVKAWGHWWIWEPRLTMALLLWLIYIAYLLVRRYGGPGSDKLAAAVGVFGTAVSPFVYVSVNLWRTIHPLNTVVPTLKAPFRPAFGVAALAFLGLFGLLLALRVELGRRQAALDALYLAEED
jgi:heme exporter protein C